MGAGRAGWGWVSGSRWSGAGVGVGGVGVGEICVRLGLVRVRARASLLLFCGVVGPLRMCSQFFWGMIVNKIGDVTIGAVGAMFGVAVGAHGGLLCAVGAMFGVAVTLDSTLKKLPPLSLAAQHRRHLKTDGLLI